MHLRGKARFYLEQLKEQWKQRQRVPGIFAYTLNVTAKKHLPGPYAFYSEYNPERSALRRLPQTIASLSPTFSEEKFNFKKIKPQELLLNIDYDNATISMIINNSPLTPYHTLICPNVAEGLPQRITHLALSFSIMFLLAIAQPQYRIGYNSPGALASVNHLHLHLLDVETELYIDRALLAPLLGNDVCRLRADMPTEAICFLIHSTDSESEVAAKIQEIYKFIVWLCEEELPHNLFMTLARNGTSAEASKQTLKIFIYARHKYYTVKDLTSYNVAFCEMSGFVPIGNKQVYDSLTEQEVLTEIRAQSGDAYDRIYNYFTNAT